MKCLRKKIRILEVTAVIVVKYGSETGVLRKTEEDSLRMFDTINVILRISASVHSLKDKGSIS